MAMYPNATHGYMPFVKPAHKRQAAKRTKAEKDSLKSKAADGTKTYKVTMRDRRGFTYTYIIQADASKSLPVLCESRVTAPNSSPLLSNSLPNMRGSARFPVSTSRPESRSCASLADGKEHLTKVDGGEKKGLFNSLLQYIKKKTSSKSSSSKTSSTISKSKRKVKPLPQRKRQRTVSAMSNLDPIQESPEEDNLDDTDSYSHDSVTTSGSESESGDGHESCP